MRIVFMGTPEFSVPSLDALVREGYEVVGVFTQPDRPAGRGNKMMESPVKQYAAAHGLPVYQFERIRKQIGLDTLRSLKPNLVVTAAFGQILSQKILDVPVHGTVNVHASLLPAYRGPAPINQAIAHGEIVAGVTTMLTDIGIDTGDMLLSASLDILPDETAGELSVRLSRLGADLLIETLKGYFDGSIVPQKQDESKMSYQGMLTREMGNIDWTKSAEEISWLARGYNPWPGTYTAWNGSTLKIWNARPSDRTTDAEPGTVIVSSAKEGLFVACGEGVLEITEIQAPGAKRMPPKSYLMGKKIEIGTKLGDTDGSQKE